MTYWGLTADMADLNSRIRSIVQFADPSSLNRMVQRDLLRNGFLPGGWAIRWPDNTPEDYGFPPPIPKDLVPLDDKPGAKPDADDKPAADN